MHKGRLLQDGGQTLLLHAGLLLSGDMVICCEPLQKKLATYCVRSQTGTVSCRLCSRRQSCKHYCTGTLPHLVDWK